MMPNNLKTDSIKKTNIRQTTPMLEKNFSQIKGDINYQTYFMYEQLEGEPVMIEGENVKTLQIGAYEIQAYEKGEIKVNGQIISQRKSDTNIFSGLNENYDIRFYDDGITLLSKGEIITNPGTSEEVISIRNDIGTGININEKGDIIHSIVSNNGFNVYTTNKNNLNFKNILKLDRYANKETEMHKSTHTLAEINEPGTLVGEFIDIYGCHNRGINNSNFFITNDGKPIVIGKQSGDRFWSVFIDGKKVKGTSNMNKIEEVKRVGDSKLYIKYKTNNNVPIWCEVNLGDNTLVRRKDDDIAVTRWRSETLKKLDNALSKTGVSN